MAEIIKTYTNNDITVVWKPDMCIHSRLCWKGLTNVFNPKARPWINMQAGITNDIIAQVDKCPSGALSYYKNNEVATGEDVKVDTVIEVMANGPLLVYGNLTLKHKDGSSTAAHKVTAFCRCGASANKPFCDGSHVKINFKDE